MKKIIQILITFVLCLAIVKLSCVGLRDSLNEYFVPETSYVYAMEPESPVSPNETLEFITGPVASDVGELCVFKLNSETRADWVVVRQIDKDSPPQFYIDTSGSALAFSSSIAAKYTIVASVIEEGRPRILQHVCDYGIAPEPKPDPKPMPNPEPEPEPEPKTLSEWIRQNVPEAGKPQAVVLASCYRSAAEGIEKGTIKSSEAAFSVIRTNTQTKIKLDVWQKFLDELSVKINEKLAGTTDVKKLGEIFSEIANSLSSVSPPVIPKKPETVVPPQRTPAPQVRVVTPARQADCATGTCPAPQPRFFRSR